MRAPTILGYSCRSPPPESKWVAKLWRKRMRCRRVRQSQRHPYLPHLPLDYAGIQPLAAHTHKQRAVARHNVWAQRDISVDRVRHNRQHRYHAFLVAFTDDPHGLPQGGITPLQPQRFRDAQPTAIQQRQNGCVARRHPGLDVQRIDHVDAGEGGLGAQWLGHGVGCLGSFDAPDRLVGRKAVLFEMAKEAAQGRQRATKRCAGYPVVSPFRHIAAKIRNRQRGRIVQAQRCAPVVPGKGKERFKVAPVGRNGVGRILPLVGKRSEKVISRRGGVGGGGPGRRWCVRRH